MSNQDRFGTLQMRVCGHGGTTRFVSSAQRYVEPVRQKELNLVDAVTNIEAKIGSDLLVAATPAVQFVTGVTDQVDQLFLDKVVYILGLVVIKELWRILCSAGDLLQALENLRQLFRRYDSVLLQIASV